MFSSIFMCGRFTLTVEQEEILETFPGIKIREYPGPRYNISPSQNIAAIINEKKEELKYIRWGLIPSWFDDSLKSESKMINARAETLHEKPSFRNLFKKQRCLVLSNGFFEWQKSQNKSVPFYFILKSKKLFAFAGLWDRLVSQDITTTSCTIITTAPNELLSKVHNRMPVILKSEYYDLWLSNETNTDKLASILKSYPADEMEFYPVSRIVNNPKNDTPDCIKRI